MTDLFAARSQMAILLAFHIIFAVVGIGMPVLMVLAEHRWQRTSDRNFPELAHRWAKGTATLFAVGADSTVESNAVPSVATAGEVRISAAAAVAWSMGECSRTEQGVWKGNTRHGVGAPSLVPREAFWRRGAPEPPPHDRVLSPADAGPAAPVRMTAG